MFGVPALAGPGAVPRKVERNSELFQLPHDQLKEQQRGFAGLLVFLDQGAGVPAFGGD